MESTTTLPKPYLVGGGRSNTLNSRPAANRANAVTSSEAPGVDADDASGEGQLRSVEIKPLLETRDSSVVAVRILSLTIRET